VKRRLPALGLVFGALGAFGCGPVEVPDARRHVIETWGESLLRDNYGQVKRQSSALSTRAEAFLEAPDAESLDALQRSWVAVRSPWKRAEIFGFGPNVTLPERFVARIDFWPVRPRDIEQAVTAGKGSSTETLGASETGLPALEYLLFAPDAEAQLGRDRERRMFLLRVARELDAAARELFTRWDPRSDGYYHELVEAGRDSRTYETLHAALQEMVRQAVFLLDKVQMLKLEAPLGLDGVPAPELAESPSSGRALADVHDNLTCIEIFYFGEGDWHGLDWYLLPRGKSRGAEVRLALAEARQALDAIDGDLQQAVVTDPERVREAALKVQALKRVFEVDIVNALSLSVGYNPNDTD
jgi:predicted lipoprotein